MNIIYVSYTLIIQLYEVYYFYFSESILTSLVKDDVGGNSKTRVIFCLKPHNEPSFFEPIHRFVYQCTQVKNFPVLNDPFAQVSTRMCQFSLYFSLTYIS